MRLTFAVTMCLLLAAGCTNNQLRRSTVGQASTLSEIQHRQVLQNLASFAGNPYAIPRHVTLHDGTAQITDNGSVLGQVVSGRFFNMGAQRTIVDQWSMLPVTNDVALRLLRTAYRRALGSGDDLYTDDLANDFAQEIKKQTYQVDDLRTLVNNRELIKRAEESFASDRTPQKDEDTVPVPVGGVPVTQRSTRSDGTVVEEMVTPTPFRYKKVAGIGRDEAIKARNRFDKVVSANAIDIIYPGERIDRQNLAVIEFKDPQSADPSFSVFREATPLVIELRRQVYDTNKDFEEIADTGWLGRSQNKHDIPHDACYVADAKECGKAWYVWVCPANLKEFEDFTLKILNFSGLIKEPMVSGATGVKFTPSGNNSGGLR